MNIFQETVIITGAGSGLGAATAKLLAKAGAKVALLDKASHALEHLTRQNHGVAYQCDITDEIAVKAILDIITQELGAPRICINCAGIFDAKRIIGKHGPMLLDDFRDVININLIGIFNIMRLVAQKMAELPVLNQDNERGVIINTASIAAYEGQVGQVAYSASKAGIIGMTLPAARELAQHGIRVMAVAPGVMDTPMMAQTSDAVRENLAASIPFPKRLGHADEFAVLIQHIIENNYLNGSVIRLDGALRL